MLELARVVAIPTKRASAASSSTVSEKEVLWVETLVRTSCSDCSVKSTCGHSVLSRWFARKRQCIPVACKQGEASLLAVGQWVEVGVPEQLVLRASFLAYLVPLFGLLLGALLFSQATLLSLFQVNMSAEAGSMLGACIGLILGLMLSRFAGQHWMSSDVIPRFIRTVQAPNKI